MTGRRVIVYADRDGLVAAVAERFLSTLDGLCHSNDRLRHVALTGGSAGIAVLAAVRELAGRDRIPWSRVHLWWGDERWVPTTSSERNELQARDALIDALPIPADNVHAFAASDEGVSLEIAAERYAEELRRFREDGFDHPRFDVTFLGVGPDGHIASLFPGEDGVTVTDRSVIAVRNSPKPPPERLSLTLPVIDASDRVWLVMSGEDKSWALSHALETATPVESPAGAARGQVETRFFVDAAAAAKVPRELRDTDV